MKGLYYAVSFIAGGAVGVLASKKYFEKKYEAIFEEEIESIKESRVFMGHIKEKDSINNTDFNKAVEEALKNPESDLHSSIDNMFKDEIEEHKKQVEYMNMIKEKEHPIEEVEEETEDINEEPYEISEYDYENGELGYDKITLHYYSDEDVLVNVETDQPEIGRTIGDEGINKIRLTDESSTYFRDELYGCDYEVIKIIGSYYVEEDR